MIPVLIGSAVLWGMDTNEKIKRANNFNSQAAAIAEKAKNEVESVSNAMNNTLDLLGKTELGIMTGNVEKFVSLMSSIYDDFEFRRNLTGLEKLEQMGFRRKVIEELQAMTTKAVELGSTPEIKKIGDTSFGAVGLLGAGALAIGLEVIVAPAMLLYGMMKSDEATAAFYEARTRLDEAHLYEQRCLNLCALFDAIKTRGRMLNKLLNDLNSYLTPAVDNMRTIVSRLGYGLDNYPEREYLGVYYAYQITNTVKIIIETPVVQNDWSINPALDQSIEIGQKNVGLLKDAN